MESLIDGKTNLFARVFGEKKTAKKAKKLTYRNPVVYTMIVVNFLRIELMKLY